MIAIRCILHGCELSQSIPAARMTPIAALAAGFTGGKAHPHATTFPALAPPVASRKPIVMSRSLLHLAWAASLGCWLTVTAWSQTPPVPDATPDANLFPRDLVAFSATKTPSVFDGEAGSWDTKIRERGWILREANQYRLWYTGYDGTPDGIRRLGYATSPDGRQWTKSAKNPLLPDLWVEDMYVIKAQNKYWMFAEGARDQAQLLSSNDGVDWQHIGSIDIRMVDGSPISPGPYGTPTAWYENERWYLFYERRDQGVWLATSSDMKVWTHVQDSPVLVPGPNLYDRDMIALNQILKRGDRYFAYYHGCAKMPEHPTQWCTCIATSLDLTHWEKYPLNPLLPVEDNQSSGFVIEDAGRVRLYTMHPEVHVHPSIAP